MLGSIGFLTYLLSRREKLHPDILHFVTCLYEDQVHLLWAFVIWASFKTLCIPSGGLARLNQTTVIAGLEIMVALLFSFSFSVSNVVFLFSLLAILYLRNLKPDVMNLTISFFVFYYTTLNFWVNTIDFFWNYALWDVYYYHDEDFVTSFSYKTHTCVLIITLSFISAQFVHPSVALLKEVPVGLTFLHMYTLPVLASLFFNFLFELTAMAAEVRFKVFRQELLKVFMTGVMFYFMTLWLTSWVFTLSSALDRTRSWKEEKVLA